MIINNPSTFAPTSSPNPTNVHGDGTLLSSPLAPSPPQSLAASPQPSTFATQPSPSTTLPSSSPSPEIVESNFAEPRSRSQCNGPHVMPSPPSTNKKKLEPAGNLYTDNLDGTSSLTNVMKSKLTEPYRTWRDIPLNVVDEWFEEWKKYVYWELQHEMHIRNAFEIVRAKRMADHFNRIKYNGKMPGWMLQSVYDNLLEWWKTPEFLSKSVKNKQNRASTKGGILHTGGCISAATLRKRLSERENRDIPHEDIYKITRTRKSDKKQMPNENVGDTGEGGEGNNEGSDDVGGDRWVDESSRLTYENYEKLKEIRNQQAAQLSEEDRAN